VASGVLPQGLVSREEAARIAGVHPNTVRNWEKIGRVTTQRVARGGRTYVGIPLAEVEAIRAAEGGTPESDERLAELRERVVRMETELRGLTERLAEIRGERDELFRRLLDTRPAHSAAAEDSA